MVVTDDILSSRTMKELIEREFHKLPKLGLNCVGGSSATDIARLLE